MSKKTQKITKIKSKIDNYGYFGLFVLFTEKNKFFTNNGWDSSGPIHYKINARVV